MVIPLSLECQSLSLYKVICASQKMNERKQKKQRNKITLRSIYKLERSSSEEKQSRVVTWVSNQGKPKITFLK